LHSQVKILTKDRSFPGSFRSGVSLHSHTKHSRESLAFIAGILRKQRLIGTYIERRQRHCRHETGIVVDLDHAYWTPPLNGPRALDLEKRQIEGLDLRAMVSLSDHDNIDAPLLLRAESSTRDTPISVEWTVPFGRSKFHLGIHNLPAGQARELMSRMRECTARHSDEAACAMIAELHSLPAVLIVFNHPVWNLYALPAPIFESELDRFLQGANRFLDAFELNGLRSRQENQRVADLATKWNQLVISGGDRHGCEPNANINLTDADDFEEFVSEIRNERRSTVLFMPQYEEPMVLRLFQNFLDIIRHYPEFEEGERKWDERTFHPNQAGAILPVSALWPNGTPSFFRKLFGVVSLMEHRQLQETMRSLIPGDRTELFLAAEASDRTDLSPAWSD
jgi:hypothetical protein